MSQILEALSEVEILGLTIIGEARGEPIEGQVAVGCVVRNRCLKYKKNYHDICLEPYQFSCWNKLDVNRPFLDELAAQIVNGQKLTTTHYKQCLWVASGIEDYSIADNTGGACFYMERSIFTDPKRPKWAKDARNVIYIRNHTFFQL